MYLPHELREILGRTLAPTPSPADLEVAAAGLVARPAAVLVPLIADGPEPRVVFTQRSATLSRHAGEISFPGGLPDPGEDLAEAALREAEEEVGIRAASVEMLGTLAPVHTRVSGITIVPFVGLLLEEPAYTPNAAEIASVLVFGLRRLSEVAAERAYEWEGSEIRMPVFDVDGHVIWGATARILRSLLDAIA